MFHMAWFLKQGVGVQGWGAQFSGTIGTEWMRPDFYIDMARQLERACFDYMMIEDSLLVNDIYKGSMEFALNRGYGVPKSDPMPMLPLMAYGTKHIGVVGTIATPFYPPYTAARLGTTLDQVTNGRVGLNLVTASSHRSAQNYGLDQHYEHDKRYEMADEWIDCVNQLWDSWEPGSVVMDENSRMVVDYTKVHTVNFEGKYYKSRGPLNTAPGPQRRPVICQAGGSPAGRAFGSKHADTIIATGAGVEEMKGYKEDVVKRMNAYGRDPETCKVLFLISPIIAETDDAARDKRDRQRAAEAADFEARLERMSYYSGFDMSKFDLDEPLPENFLSRVNGHQSTMNAFVKSGRTLREMTRFANIESIEFYGSPDTVAAQMGEVMEEVGGDGYLFANTVTRRTVAEIADGLAPALKKRGLIRKGYDQELFRDNLLAF
jgi:FMN-dependent oxidoreductase (nitrilotriacetate monooxygenase family)